MNRFSILLICMLSVMQVFAASKPLTREEYIQKFYPLAISEMQRSGIPASITLAQGCWESGNGNSRLATEANNHFGIKCKKEWTGKTIRHDDDARQECFRKYAHAEASYIDHTNFLMNGSRYKFLFQLDPKDYTGWAVGLKKAGYATDPTYAQRLIKIIEEHKLYIYDEYMDNRQIASIKQDAKPVAELKTPSLDKTNASHKIELRNGLHTIVVGEGDTYESLTRELKLKDWELATYNDLDKGRALQKNEILYIEAKYKKANRAHKQHVVEKEDKMHYIAQRYGLRLKPLLKRNRMKAGDEPAAWEIVYLRNNRPRKG
ncbi:MAG TPA: glucosaminidase domain-containing protein [Prolixibacteraceae bacterium]|nr:glucosaminidase domain-containing protein [Prolixibacteraceae bacterium]